MTAHPISKDHSRLVLCLFRSLLVRPPFLPRMRAQAAPQPHPIHSPIPPHPQRDARRIRHSHAPFLFLQERPRRESYSHLWEVTADNDAKVLDGLLPSYLRHEMTTCELKAQVRKTLEHVRCLWMLPCR